MLIAPYSSHSMKRNYHEAGSANPLLVASILLALVAAVLAGVSVWAFTNYQDQKNNTDAKIAVAVTAAEKAQADKLEKDFVEREKQPFDRFSGPVDLGNVTFDYPKTWSLYTPSSGGGGSYEAYLHPGAVPAVGTTQAFATRVVIESRRYEDVLKTYESAVKSGALKSSPITLNGFTGVRFDGKFSTTREGSAVVFKVRDKTLVLATDSPSFRADFDGAILKSLDFNP